MHAVGLYKKTEQSEEACKYVRGAYMDMAKMTLKVGAFVFALCLGCISMQAKGQECNSNDNETLLLVKQYLGDPPSLVTWQASTDCCSGGWHGVTCNFEGRVTGVNLFRLSDVAGTIYPRIDRLTFLEFLSFVRIPGLEGEIPATVGTLINLKDLHVDSTRVSGRIPNSITGLENLNRFTLTNNKLTGPIPDSFQRMTRLLDIELFNNQLTGPLPPSLGQLPSLVSIAVSNNKLSGSIPTSLPATLTRLWLDHNRFSGKIPESLAKLDHLSSFNVTNNQLEGHIPSGLSSYGALAFQNNRCLCDRPFLPCPCCQCPISKTVATM